MHAKTSHVRSPSPRLSRLILCTFARGQRSKNRASRKLPRRTKKVGRDSVSVETRRGGSKKLRNRGPVIRRQHTILSSVYIQNLTHLDSLCIKTQSLLLISKEVLHVLTLVALELNYLTHLCIGDDSAIAGKLLLDHLEDLLLVEFFGQSLDCG
jgi:hypothetical protein